MEINVLLWQALLQRLGDDAVELESSPMERLTVPRHETSSSVQRREGRCSADLFLQIALFASETYLTLAS
jgi:hypothetical protein